MATAPKPAASKAAQTQAKPATQTAKPPLARAELAKQIQKHIPAPRAGENAGPNFEIMSQNLAKLIELGGRAAAAYLKPVEDSRSGSDLAEDVSNAVSSLGDVAEYWMADPKRMMEAQAMYSTNFINLWASTLQRLRGEESEPILPNDPTDKRFADPEWTANPIFDFLRQAYGLTTRWASDLITRADDIDPALRDRAHFYLRQIAGAVSPSNFLPTNPELLRTTLAQNGENLVRGMTMLAEDIEAGNGKLKIRQSDTSKFQLGVNMATTPGKVIFRNDLMELIQYAPSTPTVYKRPLLIVPPWINKFYVLDLNPEKSFIRWAVEQGLTVFVVSWVNPDARQAFKSFSDYMREGIFAALDTIEKVTGEKQVSAIGYCVGGTLLSVTLAYMAAVGMNRISSATLFTTQVDFRDAGDLKVFVDEAKIKSIEAKMLEDGYLDGSQMAAAFNMLRPNELIWNYIVNNYLKGKDPMPFDLLTWNADSTRMPAANHSFYLRNFYLENKLTKGSLKLDNVSLDLSKVKIPIYNLAAKEDHIAPARSVFTGARYFGGPMRYVLSGSGHIAGVVNPPSKPKYQYWIGPAIGESFDDWMAKSTEHPGSWWLDWIKWITDQAPEKVPAREPGGGKIKPLCDAPGEYVRVKA